MSEMSKAIKRAGYSGDFKIDLKAAFKAGWEAREVLMNQRVAEIEKEATLKERKRCAIICDENALKSSSPSNFADNCANQIRVGK